MYASPTLCSKVCLSSNKCVSCLAASHLIQQYFATDLFQQGLTRAQTAARTSFPCLQKCVRNFWSSPSAKPIKTRLPRMPIGKHLRISTEYRMGLAVTVSEQLLITLVERRLAHEHVSLRLKCVKADCNKHFFFIFIIIYTCQLNWMHNVKTATQDYFLQAVLFVFDRVTEPVQRCNCYHLEAQNVTGDRLTWTNWNQCTPMGPGSRQDMAS